MATLDGQDAGTVFVLYNSQLTPGVHGGDYTITPGSDVIGETTPPQIANISPAPGNPVAVDTIVQLDISDNLADLALVQVLCYYPDGTTKVVFKNGAFKDASFIGAPNVVVPIAGGYRLYIRPVGDPRNGGGWQQLPQFDVDGIDGDGNSAVIV